jgi:hypothetical protein
MGCHSSASKRAGDEGKERGAAQPLIEMIAADQALSKSCFLFRSGTLMYCKRPTNHHLIAITGNGLSVSEDLARHFLICQLNARCEDPEQRPFAADFLCNIELRRAEFLSAALMIWRWGRHNARELSPGRPLGSFEQWTEWCRDPLVALGCCDPVARIDQIRSDDPQRREIVELFETWHAHHRDQPVKAKVIAEPVRALLDSQGRRQFMAARPCPTCGHAC